MKDIIEVNSLVKRFGSLVAVNDISFSVRKGELFAFLGPNGAGKSTTINILCTLMKQDSGEAAICGFRAGKEDDRIRRKIGVVFQGNCLDGLLTVRQNLVSRACLYENSMGKLRQGIAEVSRILHIEDLLDRPFGKLSGGQKRRCEIARALMNLPEVLFLDEPSTGLDPQTRCHVWECIGQLREKYGTSVFLTTHYMEEAAGADNIAIIDGGKIVACGSPAALKERYASDLLKVSAGDMNSIKTLFTDMGVNYQVCAGSFNVRIKDSIKALEILKKLEKYLLSFEVQHGTMDDVFLNITGRALRED